jgi:hypothetical protein
VDSLSDLEIKNIQTKMQSLVAKRNLIKVGSNLLLDLETGELVLTSGGNFGFWASNQREIGAFIAAEKLKPITAIRAQEFIKTIPIGAAATATPAASTVTLAKAQTVTKLPEPIKTAVGPQIWINGGMKNPHFHYEGNIYELNTDQWRQFTKATLEKFNAKLAKAQSISFDSFMAVSTIAEELT